MANDQSRGDAGEGQDAAIHAEERVDRRANDGKLTSGERQHLERQLNRNSRQIYREKHNARTRK